MLANEPSRQVKSVKTAVNLIDRIQALGGAKPAELTEELELSKSSVHNYLATLEMEGYVVNDDGKYRLGLKFLTHGTAAKNMAGIKPPIFKTLRDAAEELSLTTWWVAEEHGRGFFMEYAIPDGSSQVYGSVGKRSYLHEHAPGKAILANSSDDYIERVVDYHGLPGQTKRTTTDFETLLAELDDIRERGFAVSEGEAVLGIISVGAGFRDDTDRRHAIGVFEQTRDIVGDRTAEIGERLVEETEALERQLVDGGRDE
jgi:DNA-binding IclR family transcriptional regulator